jgi:CrcB protein
VRLGSGAYFSLRTQAGPAVLTGSWPMRDAHAASRLNRLRSPRRALTPYLAISAGGALGANARYLVASWATTQWGTQFPVGTLLINVSGSFVIGLYLTLATERFTGHPAVRLFVATGFLGGYTTFSTFSVEALRLIETGNAAAGISYMVASVVLSIVAAAIGMIVAYTFLSRSTRGL